ncbi:glycosyltransferase [Labilibaculum antarcticum]|nr:glycosyltransferase family 2 protein [Labilibaculum antarcticum]
MNDIVNKPKISVIVCCYRGEDTIVACLESLLHQDIQSELFEVIIVDDGSIDRSSEIIKNFLKTHLDSKHPDFKYFSKINEGLSIARNFGIDKSNSDLVVYIDEDAVVYEDYLKIIIDYFDCNPSVNCLGGEVELYNNNIYFARVLQDSIFSHYMKNEKSVIGTNMAFRKIFLNDVGRFQPEFTYRGDETALFAKANDKLVIGRSQMMRVKHFQPPNIKSWLKTRFENGYFTAAIDHFIGKSTRGILLKLLKSSLFVLVPLFLLIALILFGFSNSLALSLLVIIVLIILKKFFLNGFVMDVIKEFRVKRNNRNQLKDEIFILYLIIIGTYKEDFGYIKGCYFFRNQKWCS